MTIELHLHRHFDRDLILYHKMGLPVAAMAERALIAYARGEPIYFIIPPIPEAMAVPFHTVPGEAMPHIRVHVKDKKVEELLADKSLPRKKGLFTKMVLREALLGQSSLAFLKGSDPLPERSEQVRRIAKALSDSNAADTSKIRIIYIDEKMPRKKIRELVNQ